MFFGRFTVMLSNGQTIREKFPDEASAPGYMGWSQLQEFCSRENLTIHQMGMIIGDSLHKAPDDAEEYFVNMQQQTVIGHTQEFYRGFGFKKDSQWFILWLDKDGDVVTMEIRDG